VSGRRFTGEVLVPGAASGPALVLAEPLSFWGGFDPRTGTIVDRRHPQCGARLAGTILVVPGTRGSATASGTIAEAIRRGTAPAGLVLSVADVNLMVGAMIAEQLYGLVCPVLVAGRDGFARFESGSAVTIAADGTIELARNAPDGSQPARA